MHTEMDLLLEPIRATPSQGLVISSHICPSVIFLLPVVLLVPLFFLFCRRVSMPGSPLVILFIAVVYLHYAAAERGRLRGYKTL